MRQGVFFNQSPSNPEGINELRIAEGDTVRLEAVTYPELKVPQYRWESSDSNIVAIEPDPVDASVAWAIAVGDSGQTATLRVFGRADRLKRQMQVEVLPPRFRTLPGGALLTLPGGALLEMVRIPPGTFQMGSPPSEQGRYDNEGPVHEVTISQGFYLGKYEVTQAQWEAVMGSNPSGYERCGGGDCPVQNVSWDDAQAFIERLNAMEVGARYRLPSEAEWEYAARAGTTGARYSADLNAIAWYSDNSRFAKHPVGGKEANAYGLHDMLGNVWEWVQDCWNESYQGAPTDGSAWESGDCSERVLRGGASFNNSSALRAAIRGGSTTGRRSSNFGFRIARTVTP